MATKKRSSLAAELAQARKRPKVTTTFRIDEDDLALLDKLVEGLPAKGRGELLALLIRRAAKENGFA